MDAAETRFACDDRFPGPQVVRLIRRAIGRHRLDLRGLRVLTEAAVGYRRVTPVIAAVAGADAVYAVGRDSLTASRKDAERQAAWLAAVAGVHDRITFLPTRLQAPLATVDVVTDLPGVRPIDESIVRTLTDSAVVTLMRSAAYWRAAEVDVATCRRAGIAVAGLDEEAVAVHRYLPMHVLWGLLSLGVEVVGATVVVAGGGDAYAHVVRGLAQAGAQVLVVSAEPPGRVGLYGGERIGASLGEAGVLGRLAEADALVLCPGEPDERFVGPGAAVDATRVAGAAPHLAVVGEEADADLHQLAAAGLLCRPEGDEGHLFDLLPQPVVDLHAAGLKVGEVMTRARRRGSSPLAAEQLAAAEAHAELLPQDLSRGVR